MKQLFLIFMGGGLGSVSRFLLGKWVQNISMGVFPIGTLTVNILASFVLGILVGRFSGNETLKLLLAVGFCGGFSTFSSFSNDTLELLQNNRMAEAFFNIVLNVVLCLLAVYVGNRCSIFEV